jgi:2-polyprenyl-3-methyl-5-hydroxy-6-metoxy-1,4-benzoquinol methylase
MENMMAPKTIYSKSIDPEKLKGLGLGAFNDNVRMVRDMNSALALHKEKGYESNCLVCGSDQKTPVVTVHGIDYVQCMDCTHVYQSRYIPDQYLYDFFEHDTDINVHVAEGQFEYRHIHVNKPKAKALFDLFEETQKKFENKRWLDCACGAGDMMYAVKEFGWNSVGFDIGRPGIEIARKAGLDAHCTDIDGYLSGPFKEGQSVPFDVISAIGYLDVVDPVKTINSMKKMMRKGSFIIVDQPKFSSVAIDLIRRMPETAIRYLNAAQRSNFTPQSLRKLFTDAGFAVRLEWYFGLDMYQLLCAMCVAEPRFVDSEIYKTMVRNFNRFQSIIDDDGKSDSMVFAAELL